VKTVGGGIYAAGDNMLGCSTVMPSELEIVISSGTPGVIPRTSRRPTQVILVEAIGGVVWAAFCWTLLLRIFAETAPQLPIVYSAAAILLGLVLSDFMSGFLHWFFDTFFEETTPFIGPHLITSFREHHRDPTGMTRHGFLELTGNSFLAYLLPLALVWWFGPASPESKWGVFNYTCWVSFTIALTMTNQLHCWAHRSRRSASPAGFTVAGSPSQRHTTRAIMRRRIGRLIASPTDGPIILPTDSPSSHTWKSYSLPLAFRAPLPEAESYF